AAARASRAAPTTARTDPARFLAPGIQTRRRSRRRSRGGLHTPETVPRRPAHRPYGHARTTRARARPGWRDRAPRARRDSAQARARTWCATIRATGHFVQEKHRSAMCHARDQRAPAVYLTRTPRTRTRGTWRSPRRTRAASRSQGRHRLTPTAVMKALWSRGPGTTSTVEQIPRAPLPDHHPQTPVDEEPR